MQNQLCYDQFSGKYFLADEEALRERVKQFNEKLLNKERENELKVSLHDIYEMINKDLPDNMKIGTRLFPDLQVEIDEKVLEENQNYEAITVKTELAEDGLPIIRIDFDISKLHFEAV